MERRRVVFCTYSSIYSSLVLEELLDAEGIDVVGIVNSIRVFKRGQRAIEGALALVRRTGLRYAFYLLFITGLYEKLQWLTTIKSIPWYAKRHAIPSLSSEDINDSEGQAFIAGLKPDVLVCANFNQLVGDEVRALPGLAGINIHPAPLPAYRGVDPLFYQLLNGERQIGVSVHLMDSAFDSGNLLAEWSTQRQSGRSLFFSIASFSNGVRSLRFRRFSGFSRESRALRRMERVDTTHGPTRCNWRRFASVDTG